MYEGFRVPQDSARAVGPDISQSSTKLRKIPHGFHKAPQCSTKGVSCARRLKSHRIKIALLMGGTLSKTEINGFFAHFHCFVTCSLAQANVGFVANQITSLRNSRGSRVNAWHCCLVGFGFQEFHEYEVKHQILQKLWGSPEERFQQSFTLSSTKVA